jgi:hypothetical protein
VTGAGVPGANVAGSGPSTPLLVRPVKSARIATVIALAVLVAFVIIAIVLPDSSDGVTFTTADQFGIGGTGLLVVIGILMFRHPRLRADASGVDSRGFMGTYRHVEWDLVNAVEFPPKVRFARLVLPGDELIPLYAVQRGDRERSVSAMQRLRELHSDWLSSSVRTDAPAARSKDRNTSPQNPDFAPGA